MRSRAWQATRARPDLSTINLLKSQCAAAAVGWTGLTEKESSGPKVAAVGSGNGGGIKRRPSCLQFRWWHRERWDADHQ